MSYLDLPRLNFKGRFYTDVSTINNQVTNYPPGATIDPLWNSAGHALFKFDGCVVTGVQTPGGGDDSLIGAEVTTPGRPAGKLVDLDTAVQQLSQVIGVSIQVATADGAGFKGTLTPTNLQDLWTRSEATKGIAGASSASVIFVSTIGAVTWTNADGVPALRLLREASVGAKLAIRFTIGSFFWGKDPQDPDNGYGTLVGSIAPCLADDPPQFVRRRLIPPAAAEADFGSAIGHDAVDSLRPAAAPPSLSAQAANFHLDTGGSRLSIDLGNSFMVQGFNGPPVPLPRLRAVILDGDSVEPIDPPFEYSAETNDKAGGIVDLALTEAQCRSLGGRRAAVQAEEGSGWQTILAEHKSGKYANIAPFTSRAVGGESVEVELRAFQWGAPLAGETMQLGGTIKSSGSPTGSPPALVVTGNLGHGAAKTDGSGRAAFSVETPAEMTIPEVRKELDSLPYTLGGPWIGWGGGRLSRILPAAAVLVWAPYEEVADPTWEKHVKPVFDEFMRIYPGMKAILDLSDRPTVEKPQNAQAILAALSLPFESPHYMPVTRDLSPQKIEVIKTWLSQFVPA